MGRWGDDIDRNRRSVSHHDLWLSEGEIFFQRVSVAKTPPNPVLEVHFEKLRVNADARQVLTENHILVKDMDTVLNDDTVDASKIPLRVSGLGGGYTGTPFLGFMGCDGQGRGGWSPQSYYAFTLAGCAGREDSLSGRRRSCHGRWW